MRKAKRNEVVNDENQLINEDQMMNNNDSAANLLLDDDRDSKSHGVSGLVSERDRRVLRPLDSAANKDKFPAIHDQSM